MTKLLDLRLSSYRFDEADDRLRRDRVGDPAERSETYDQRYDFKTFIYDAYYDDEAKEVRLICPALLNFGALLEACQFSVDGAPTKMSGVDPLSRGALVRIPSEHAPNTISFEHELFRGAITPGKLENDHFAGLNTVFAISKDNGLDWIQDWLAYYVKNHGLQAVLIFDNQSTAYTMEDLGEALTSVDGIEKAAIVRAWFPFGPGGFGNTNFNSKFLHMTMVDLGRRRLLQKARAALNVDIDEFVYARGDRTIFDATADSENGYLRMDGKWVYARSPFPTGRPRHADHRFVRKDNNPKVNRKWCVAPTGPLGGEIWRTHRIISRRDPTTDEFGFWHFRQISNGWDYARDEEHPDDLVLDARLAGLMETTFGEPAPSPMIGDPSRRMMITYADDPAAPIGDWVAHHRRLGFTDFLVYSDADGPEHPALDQAQAEGALTHERISLLRRGPVRSALHYARLHPLKAECGWLCALTPNEWLPDDQDWNAELTEDAPDIIPVAATGAEERRVICRNRVEVERLLLNGPRLYSGVAENVRYGEDVAVPEPQPEAASDAQPDSDLKTRFDALMAEAEVVEGAPDRAGALALMAEARRKLFD